MTSRRGRALYPSIGFVMLCVMPIAFVWGLMGNFIALAFQDNTFAYILLIPVVSPHVFYLERKSIFSMTSYGWRTGGRTDRTGSGMFELGSVKFLAIGVGQSDFTSKCSPSSWFGRGRSLFFR
jgi:hypothetical protein